MPEGGGNEPLIVEVQAIDQGNNVDFYPQGISYAEVLDAFKKGKQVIAKVIESDYSNIKIGDYYAAQYYATDPQHNYPGLCFIGADGTQVYPYVMSE